MCAKSGFGQGRDLDISIDIFMSTKEYMNELETVDDIPLNLFHALGPLPNLIYICDNFIILCPAAANR